MNPPNLDFLLKNSDLTEADVCKMTVAEIRKVEKDIIKRQIEERRNDQELMERYRKFLWSYDDFVKLFGKELTDKYLPLWPLELLTNDYFWSDNKPWHKYFEVIRHGQYNKKISNGPWVKEVWTSGTCYRVPSDYQGLRHEKIIRAILREKMPWLEENFKYDCYEIHGNSWDEFYVKTGDEHPVHLYVPYEALLNHDAEAIVKRNHDYLTDFHKDNGAVKFQQLMERPLTIKFLEMLKENRP